VRLEASISAGLLIMSVALLCYGFGLYGAALAELRPRFPVIMNDEHTARWAMDVVIWEPSVPVRLRRAYLSSYLLFAGAFCGLAAFFLSEGRQGAAAAFGTMAAVFTGFTLRRQRQHRHLM
jgi:hypothetical protein